MALDMVGAAITQLQVMNTDPDNPGAGYLQATIQGIWDDDSTPRTATVTWFSEGSGNYPNLDPTKRYDVTIVEHVEELPIEE